MPLPVESLTPQSSPEEAKAAIAASLEQLMGEGKTQEQAMAQAMAMAQQAMGAAPQKKGKTRDLGAQSMAGAPPMPGGYGA